MTTRCSTGNGGGITWVSVSVKVVSFPPVQTDALPLGQLGPVEPQHTHPPPAPQILTSFAMSRTLFPHFTRFASITLGTGSISTRPDLLALLAVPQEIAGIVLSLEDSLFAG